MNRLHGHGPTVRLSPAPMGHPSEEGLPGMHARGVRQARRAQGPLVLRELRGSLCHPTEQAQEPLDLGGRDAECLTGGVCASVPMLQGRSLHRVPPAGEARPATIVAGTGEA